MSKDMSKLVSFVQQELNARYGLTLKVDGNVGPKTIDALNRVSAVPSHFSKGRRFIAFVQYLTHIEPLVDDIAVDGHYGPATENAIEQLLAIDKTGKPNMWRDKLPEIGGEDFLKSQYQWPTYNEIESVFGEPGTRQSKVTSPYKLKLAWDLSKTITRFTCHELVVEPIQSAMVEILDIYGINQIKELELDKFGGCFNYRKMRGGRKLSTHAWGIAIDWNPVKNKLRWDSSKASLAGDEYNDFWAAWERVGAVSLGREQNRDWMHLQFARL